MSEARLLRSVQRLAAVLGRLERQTAAKYGVSVSQLRILLHLAQSDLDGVRMSALAEEQALAVSTMTRNVALLEKKGWVARQTGDTDRRAVRVRLTDRGVELSRCLRNTTVGQFARAFRAFHPSDRVERAVALDRVATALERLDE